MRKNTFIDAEFALKISKNLPAFIRSVGHTNLMEISPINFWEKACFAELFWCIDGKAYFELDGKMYPVKDGDIWYYPPGSKHYFYPAETNFHYRWFTIEGAKASYLFELTNISPGASYGGKCPEELFAALELDIHNYTLRKRFELLSTSFQILCLAASKGRQKYLHSNYLANACSIMENDFSNSELNIQSLANILHVNRSQLSRDFIVYYGVSPSNYLKNIRIKKALSLLNNKALTLDEIAQACGINSGDYLGKMIIAATGKKPSEYRQ